MISQLLKELEKLRLAIHDSQVQPYNHFVTYSEHGENCPYAKLALSKFEREDYEKLKTIISDLNEEFKKIDG